MVNPSASNTSSPSTYLFRWSDIFRGRPRPRAQRAEGARLLLFPEWRQARSALQASIIYWGGAEDTWVVETRGARFVFPGHVSIGDVGRLVNGQGEQRWRWVETSAAARPAGGVPAGRPSSRRAPTAPPPSSLPPLRFGRGARKPS
jgi:hypothetical protein